MGENKNEVRLTMEANAQVGADGKFYVIMIDEGEGNGYKFTEEVLKESVNIFEGVECFIDHSLWGHSVRDLGGVFSEAAWDEQERGIGAQLRSTGPSAPIVAEMGAEMISDNDVKPAIGFSVDIMIKVGKDREVEAILRCYSVDLVFDPARGGRFVKALNSIQARWPEKVTNKEVKPMAEKLAEKELTQLEMQLEDDREAIKKDKEAIETMLSVQVERQALADEAAKAREIRRAMCQSLLEAGLASAKLPEAAKARVRKQFEGEVFEPSELDEALADARDFVAEVTGASVIQGVPGGMHLRMYNSADKLQAAVDDMLGAPREKDMAGLEVERLSGIKELYLMLTGDRRFHGGYFPNRVQLATTADFTGLVTNSLNKIVADRWAEYGKAGYDWWTNIVTVEHFETMNDITGTIVGSIKELPSLSESEEYDELSVGDSKETGTFQKYGGYVPLTLELIDRDNYRKLAQYPNELAKAGIRNISEQVAAIFTANSGVGPTMADTGALFNATAVTTAGGHANLLTTALAATQWEIVATAMYDQPMLVDGGTNLGTGKKQALNPRYCLVPRALESTARDLFLNEWKVDDSKHAQNLLKGSVVPLTVPEWTDANNYAAVADPLLAPSIFVGERFGLMPEIFIAGGELAPAVFMNDEHRIKVRHIIAVWVNDYRTLHKSNVA